MTAQGRAASCGSGLIALGSLAKMWFALQRRSLQCPAGQVLQACGLFRMTVREGTLHKKSGVPLLHAVGAMLRLRTVQEASLHTGLCGLLACSCGFAGIVCGSQLSAEAGNGPLALLLRARGLFHNAMQ